MFDVAFDLDPAWYALQHKLALSSRPHGGARIRKDRERLLIGYVDGVLILGFPHLEVSTASSGSGEGWFSLNPYRLGSLLATFSKTLRIAVGPTTITLNRFQQAHDGLLLRLGSDDPELPLLAARIDEVAAEQCHRRLLAAAEKQERIAEDLKWHRAEHATNSAPLIEFVREGSLIVYRPPEAPAEAPAKRAVVDRKQITADKVYLLCHDFRGEKITVDPRHLTHVAC